MDGMEELHGGMVYAVVHRVVCFGSVTNNRVASHKHVCILCRQVYGCQGNQTTRSDVVRQVWSTLVVSAALLADNRVKQR